MSDNAKTGWKIFGLVLLFAALLVFGLWMRDLERRWNADAVADEIERRQTTKEHR